MDLKNINWKIGSVLIGYHVFLLVTLPLYFIFGLPSLGVIAVTVALFFLTGISITAGYHRYYAHKSFTANKIVESCLLFFGTLAMEGSALQWSHDHRLHHRYTDTDKDPYGVNHGFWHAHCLWLFRARNHVDFELVPDLARNKLVMFQHKYYGALCFALNALVTLVLGLLLGDFAGALIFCWWNRVFLVHHCTWFINSLAHMWGDKTYSKELSAVDNYILALLTFGEGYHNYHHTFASDYRNGIHWYHFDPTKWLIWSLNVIGCTGKLRRMHKHTIKKIIVEHDKKLLLAKLQESMTSKKDELNQKVHELSESLSKKYDQALVLLQQYKDRKEERRMHRAQMKSLAKSINKDWKSWCALANEIMQLT